MERIKEYLVALSLESQIIVPYHDTAQGLILDNWFFSVLLVCLVGSVKGANNLRCHEITGFFKQGQRSDKVPEH